MTGHIMHVYVYACFSVSIDVHCVNVYVYIYVYTHIHNSSWATPHEDMNPRPSGFWGLWVQGSGLVSKIGELAVSVNRGTSMQTPAKCHIPCH